MEEQNYLQFALQDGIENLQRDFQTAVYDVCDESQVFPTERQFVAAIYCRLRKYNAYLELTMDGKLGKGKKVDLLILEKKIVEKENKVLLAAEFKLEPPNNIPGKNKQGTVFWTEQKDGGSVEDDFDKCVQYSKSKVVSYLIFLDCTGKFSNRNEIRGMKIENCWQSVLGGSLLLLPFENGNLTNLIDSPKKEVIVVRRSNR